MLFAKMLNYAHMLVPFKYLDLIVGGNSRKREFSKEVVDKVRMKLFFGKGRN